jgi:thiol-disulfide isomerase/thioredoxin
VRAASYFNYAYQGGPMPVSAKRKFEAYTMMKNLQMIVLFAALLAVAVLAGCSTPAKPASDVPQFSFSSLEGKTVAMKDLGNKVVIVDFWATWCGPCREEIPHLNELYSELKGKGLEIVGISMDTDGTDGVKDFAREFRIQYPIVMGDEKVAESFGGIIGLPTTFIIDRNGRIAKKYIGLPPAADMTKIVKDLVAGVAGGPFHD